MISAYEAIDTTLLAQDLTMRLEDHGVPPGNLGENGCLRL